MRRLQRIEWPRALTLWGCAALFSTGIGWAITTSDTLERVFWVTFPAVIVTAVVWSVSYFSGRPEVPALEPPRPRPQPRLSLDEFRGHDYYHPESRYGELHD